MPQALLTVKDLAVDFLIGKSHINAIHDVSFSVSAGTTLGIVGESGCGKTVTANVILQLLPKQTSRISKGSVVFDGTELLGMSNKKIYEVRGKKISMIFQDPMNALNPVYSIGNQLMEMVLNHQKVSKKEAFDLCVAMLEKVGIPSARQRMKEFPYQLSGGMQQRVMIAMALICNPMLLIADEPTTALDVTIQAQILELRSQLQKELGTSIILITHDIGVIAEMAKHVLVMYAGEIVEHGPVEGIFDRPRHPYTQGLLRSVPKVNEQAEKLYSIEGTVPSLSDMPASCRFKNRCPDFFEKCENHPPLTELEDGVRVRCWKYIEGQGDVRNE